MGYLKAICKFVVLLAVVEIVFRAIYKWQQALENWHGYLLREFHVYVYMARLVCFVVALLGTISGLIVDSLLEMNPLPEIPKPYAWGIRNIFRAPRTMRWYLHAPLPPKAPAWYDRSVADIIRIIAKMTTERVSWIALRNGLFLVVAALLSLWALYVISKEVRKTVWFRKFLLSRQLGKPVEIFGEALVEGSELAPVSVMPSCQIQLLKDGRHVGFGIRVASQVMAVPSHVWGKFGRTVYLAGCSKVAMVPLSEGVLSRVCPDLTYVSYEEKIFTSIGAKMATLRKERSICPLVTVVGHDGVRLIASTGSTEKSKLHGMCVYTASTKPGFSGAAYIANGVVVGMHSGTQNNTNCGIESGLISSELNHVVLAEDSAFKTTEMFMRKNNKDDFDTYDDLVDDAYDSEDEEDDIARYQRYKARGNLREEAAPINVNVGRTIIGQTVEPEVVGVDFRGTLVSAVNDLSEDIDQLEKRIIATEKLEERITEVDNAVSYIDRNLVNEFKKISEEFVSLRGRISTVEADVVVLREKDLEKKEKENSVAKAEPELLSVLQSPVVNPVSSSSNGVNCDICQRKLRSQAGLTVHKAVKHSMVGESAFADDVKPVVKTVFRDGKPLGNLPKKNGKNSSQRLTPSQRLGLLEKAMGLPKGSLSQKNFK